MPPPFVYNTVGMIWADRRILVCRQTWDPRDPVDLVDPRDPVESSGSFVLAVKHNEFDNFSRKMVARLGPRAWLGPRVQLGPCARLGPRARLGSGPGLASTLLLG